MTDSSTASGRRPSSSARRAVRASLLEGLERRSLFAAQPFGSVVNGALVINTGAADSTTNDTLGFRTVGARTLVSLNGVGAKFSSSTFNRIEVQTYGGNDVVDFRRMTVPTYVNLGIGKDAAYGGSGNDSLTGAAGMDTLYGYGGNDRLAGGNSADILNGGEGDDFVYAGDSDDVVDGGQGRDRIWGEAGNDSLFGGNQTDGISGGDGSDRIYGQNGNDILNGDAGKDRIYGSLGDDNITGGNGADWLMGDAGNDTINSADGAADNLVDGGDGDDTVTVDQTIDAALSAETIRNTPVVVPPVDPVDPGPNPDVPSGGGLVKGLSFGDEAFWDGNFTDAVAKAKALGVNTVRIWFEISNYDERPQAYDNIDTADIVYNWRRSTTNSQRKLTAGLAMKRAFALKDAGFNVMMTVSVNGGDPPANTQKVTDLYTHLMNATLTPGGSRKLKDAVDFWEVGQEIDLTSNWKPSGQNKQAGLRSFVDQVFVPAAKVLHGGTDTSKWEKVITPSVTNSPSELSYILIQARDTGNINLVDYIGYHPYGRYLPDQGIDEVKGRVDQVVALGKKFNKPLAATEWNLRGYANDGSQDTQWAQSIDYVYKNYIKPNFAVAIYYSLINNYQGRGAASAGAVSARPAGLFEHDYSGNVTLDSSTEDLQAYYNSPLVANQPFNNVFKAF